MGDMARRAGQKTDHTTNRITEGTVWLQSKREVSLGAVKTRPWSCPGQLLALPAAAVQAGKDVGSTGGSKVQSPWGQLLSMWSDIEGS